MNAPCFVGICPDCHRLVFASVCAFADRETGKAIADLAVEGYKIQTWDSERTRKAAWGHADICARKPKAKGRPATVPEPELPYKPAPGKEEG